MFHADLKIFQMQPKIGMVMRTEMREVLSIFEPSVLLVDCSVSESCSPGLGPGQASAGVFQTCSACYTDFHTGFPTEPRCFLNGLLQCNLIPEKLPVLIPCSLGIVLQLKKLRRRQNLRQYQSFSSVRCLHLIKA